jgi:hypothetical protein
MALFVSRFGSGLLTVFFGFFETISGDIKEKKAKGKGDHPAKDAKSIHQNGF